MCVHTKKMTSEPYPKILSLSLSSSLITISAPFFSNSHKGSCKNMGVMVSTESCWLKGHGQICSKKLLSFMNELFQKDTYECPKSMKKLG